MNAVQNPIASKMQGPNPLLQPERQYSGVVVCDVVGVVVKVVVGVVVSQS